MRCWEKVGGGLGKRGIVKRKSFVMRCGCVRKSRLVIGVGVSADGRCMRGGGVRSRRWQNAGDRRTRSARGMVRVGRCVKNLARRALKKDGCGELW